VLRLTLIVAVAGMAASDAAAQVADSCARPLTPLVGTRSRLSRGSDPTRLAGEYHVVLVPDSGALYEPLTFGLSLEKSKIAELLERRPPAATSPLWGRVHGEALRPLGLGGGTLVEQPTDSAPHARLTFWAEHRLITLTVGAPNPRVTAKGELVHLVGDARPALSFAFSRAVPGELAGWWSLTVGERQEHRGYFCARRQ
jgi:hypothetical protein